MHRRIFIISAMILVGIFLLGKMCLAATPLDIVINEVAWMGTATSTAHEWIELKNNTGEDVALSGWTLKISSSTPAIALSGTLASDGYYLLERTTDDSVPSISADKLYSGTLSNTGSSMELRDADNTLIDVVYCGGGWFSGDNTTKQTMERVDSFVAGDSVNWQNSRLPHGSPKSANFFNFYPIAHAGIDVFTTVGDMVDFDGSESFDSDGSIVTYEWNFGDDTTGTGTTTSHIYTHDGVFMSLLRVVDDYGAFATSSRLVIVAPQEESITTPTSTAPSLSVVINEFLADPLTGQTEWIELYNVATTSIDMADWYILDGSGATTTLSGIIAGNGYFVIESPKGILNNAGDSITLKYKNTIIDQVTYGDWGNYLVANAPAPGKGYSTARIKDGISTGSNNDFLETITPTKNQSNSITRAAAASSGVNNVRMATFYPGDILINEFVSDPGKNGDEWIELYNTTTQAIDLSGWIIKDGSVSITKLNGYIEAKSFFIVTKPSGSLNNAGDSITLYDPSGVKINSVTYGEWDDGVIKDNAPVAEFPYATARIEVTGTDVKDFVVTASSTPGFANIITTALHETQATSTPTSTPHILVTDGEVVINEIYPNPSGADAQEEFIELYNEGSDAINIFGWQLKDGSDAKPFIFGEQIIEPHGYAVVQRKITTIVLNNNGDTIGLINPLGTIVDEIKYERAPKGFSFSRDQNSSWHWTSHHTEGALNVFDSVTAISQVKKKIVSKNTIVTKEGVVTVEPGILGSQIFYIDGMQIYSYKKDFPQLSVGDVARVTGEVTTVSGEPHLKISNRAAIVVTRRNAAVIPAPVSVGDINESMMGKLIELHGEIVEHKGNSIFIDDGTDEIKIYLKDAAHIKGLSLRDGNRVKIVGIVSKTNAGIRVLPRYISDIAVEKNGEIKGAQETKVVYQKNDTLISYLLAVIVFLALVCGRFMFLFFKNKKSPPQ